MERMSSFGVLFLLVVIRLDFLLRPQKRTDEHLSRWIISFRDPTSEAEEARLQAIESALMQERGLFG